MSLPKPSDILSGRPPERLGGTEVEYNLDGRQDLSPAFTHLQKLELPVIAAGEPMYFLDNGAKFHADNVDLIEYATPESLGGHEVARQEAEGERITSLFVSASIGAGYFHQARVAKRTGTEVHYGEDVWRIETTGYHLNLLTTTGLPPHTSRLLMSFMATAPVLFGEGMYYRRGDYFSLSQKAHDITKEFPHDRTGSAKGMMTAPASKAGEIDPRWQRIELLALDGNMDERVTALKFNAASLVLRLAEQGIDVTRMLLPNPVTTLRSVSEDYSLEQTIDAGWGYLTALEHQRMLAEEAMKLSARVKLPPEEVIAAKEWLTLVDEMIFDWTTAKKYAGWVRKLITIEGLASRGASAMRLQQADLHWAYIDEKGLARLSLARQGMEVESKAPPIPQTRAKARSELIHAGGLIAVNWAAVEYDNEGRLLLRNPYDSRPPARSYQSRPQQIIVNK